MFNLTPVVKNLLIINVAVFILQNIIPELTAYLYLYNVNTSLFRPYQLFTYMFAHGGFMHLFFNMLMLAFTAPVLETFWGSNRFLQFYLITGMGAAVFSVFIDWFTGGGAGAMLGASGAIYGVLMGFGMLFPNLEVMLLIPPMPVKAKYLVFVLGGITFLMDRSGNVAHFAHLGGIVVAWILIKFWRSKGTYW